MTDRSVHLVGSLRGDDAEQAMRGALTKSAPFLSTLSDGETGDRDRWVVGTILGLREHPDLEVSHEGEWRGYDDQLNFRIRKGHTFRGDNLDLGYLSAYQESRPTFDRLRAEFGRPDLAFQVGIPGDLDLALFTLGPASILRHRGPFAEAISRDITAIRAAIRTATENGDDSESDNDSVNDVVFQLEIPAEMVFVAKAGPLGGAVAKWLAGGIRKLVARAPVGTRFGVHLCLGDLEHKALGRLKSTAPIVKLANAIASTWPPGRTLEFMHVPLAEGENPPPTEREFYAPLHRLRLPVGTRFVAGFLHEGRTIDQQREILRTIDALIGHPADVSSSCGLGRRSDEAADAVLAQGAALAGEKAPTADDSADDQHPAAK